MNQLPITYNDTLVNLKILMLGSSGVGKSSLILRYTADKFCEDMQNTIAVDYKYKQVTDKGKSIRLGIWDTAGQERFRTLTPTYYRGAQGIILVYDVTNRETFNKLETWNEEVELYSTRPDVVKMVVGNKTDLPNREVTVTDGLKFARKYKTLFIECSAKTSDGIDSCFMELVQKIMENPDLWENKNSNVISSAYQSQEPVHLEAEAQSAQSSYCSCSSI